MADVLWPAGLLTALFFSFALMGSALNYLTKDGIFGRWWAMPAWMVCIVVCIAAFFAVGYPVIGRILRGSWPVLFGGA